MSTLVKTQVKAAHYDFNNYVDLKRWNSYFHQIEETVALKPKLVLLIGKGDNIVETILLQQNIQVTTFDFDETLHPDIVGNVVEIKELLQDKKFEVVICCQVLEHLPFEEFENILLQFQSVANHLILSLPYAPTYFKVDFKIPYIREHRILLNLHNGHKKFKPNEQHYWEIGYKGYSKKKVERNIKKFFSIDKRFIAKHNHYHLFFVLSSL